MMRSVHPAPFASHGSADRRRGLAVETLLARRAGSDRHGVDAVAGNVAECRIDEALALKSRRPGELRAFYDDGEVRFAAPIVTGMAAVGGGIVDHVQRGRSECGGQQLPHFLFERS